MIRAILAKLTARQVAERDLSTVIARRALRLGNRKPEAAAKYERTHHILAQGVRRK